MDNRDDEIIAYRINTYDVWMDQPCEDCPGDTSECKGMDCDGASLYVNNRYCGSWNPVRPSTSGLNPSADYAELCRWAEREILSEGDVIDDSMIQDERIYVNPDGSDYLRDGSYEIEFKRKGD